MAISETTDGQKAYNNTALGITLPCWHYTNASIHDIRYSVGNGLSL